VRLGSAPAALGHFAGRRRGRQSFFPTNCLRGVGAGIAVVSAAASRKLLGYFRLNSHSRGVMPMAGLMDRLCIGWSGKNNHRYRTGH
jgi:hypothetical protein